jgi:hypothetical protein
VQLAETQGLDSHCIIWGQGGVPVPLSHASNTLGVCARLDTDTPSALCT